MRPPDVTVRIVDVHDAPVQGLVSDQATGSLNLGKLWHPSVLPDRGLDVAWRDLWCPPVSERPCPRGAAVSSPAGRSGKYSRRDTFPGSPGVRVRPPRRARRA